MSGNKVDVIGAWADDHDLDVIGVCETWLNSSIDNSEVSIPGFRLYRKDRNDVREGRGGGVLIYVKDTLRSCLCDKMNDEKCEAIFIKILCSNFDLLIGNCYRSPVCPQQEFESLLKLFCEIKDTRVLIMGDFNFPGINWEMLSSDAHGERFLAVVQDLLWHQHVLMPTRENNILDLVLTSEDNVVEDLKLLNQ